MNSIFIAANIVKRAFRNKKELIALTMLPVIVIAMMTFISGRDATKNHEVLYLNLDGGIHGEALVQYLENQDSVITKELELEEYGDLSQSGKADYLLMIPDDFSERIQSNETTEIVVYTNSKELFYTTLSSDINNFVEGLYTISEQGSEENISDFLEYLKLPTITVDYKIAGVIDANNEIESKMTSMGFVLTFIMLLVFVSMGTLMEDKKRLTLARIFTQPVKEWEIVLGNLMGSMILGLMQLIPILIVLKIVFELSWGQEFWALSLILFAFLIATLGLGIGLAGIMKNNFNPMLLTATVVVPSSILGGSFIPKSMMPDIVNRLGNIVPQKWVMDASEKILQGKSIDEILINLVVILMFGFAFSTFGVTFLKPLND
ncbi:MAG: ABC transporter permease [Dethiosulfatibacter sp.]|nr:ABC transporter permease [Dethiosulfatibacter sp.]